MEWLEQGIERHRQYVRERDAAQQVATELYGDLWKAIVEIVKSDSLRGMDLV